MGIISQTLKLKSDHPIHYWTRILCFAFSVVFLALWAGVLTEDVRADIEIFDINDGVEDRNYGMGDDPNIGICPSNRWYFPFIDEDGDFNVNWTDNNGTSWEGVVVQSEGWKGETKMVIQSIQCWSNNTTCIMLRAEAADNAHDLYLFYLWGENNASDPAAWNYTTIYGGAIKADHASMIFNRSGVLWIVTNYNGQIWERQWDIATATFLEGHTLWEPINGYPMIQVDHNDDVWYAYYTTSRLYIYHQSGDPSMEMVITSGRDKYSQFFITADNTKVCVGDYLYLSNHAFVVAYETVVNTTLMKNQFQADTDDWSTAYWSTGNCYENYVSIIQLRTEPGFDEFVRYRAQYDAVDAVWEASETALWTIPTDDDICYHYASGPNSVWPKIGGVSVSRLLSGDIQYWNYKDELGAPDDYYDIVYLDDPVFTWWNWSAPEEPEPEPEPDGNGVSDEICSSSWLIIAVMLVILIAIVGLAGNML